MQRYSAHNGFALAAAIAVGFGMQRAANTFAYRSAGATTTNSIGFVSDIVFLLAFNAATVIVALLVLKISFKGRYAPVVIGATAVYIVGLVLGWFQLCDRVVLGVLCAIPSVVLGGLWIASMGRQASVKLALATVVAGFLFKVVFGSVQVLMPQEIRLVYYVCLLIVSTMLLVGVLDAEKMVADGPIGIKPAGKADHSVFFNAYLPLFVLIAVTGVIHTTAIGTSVEYITGSFGSRLSFALALVILGFAAFVVAKGANPMNVVKFVLPVLLIILSLLPFFGREFGSLAGLIMSVCYDAYSMVFILCIVADGAVNGTNVLRRAVFYIGGGSAALVLGLSAGLLLGGMASNFDVSMMTLLSFASIYPIAIVLYVMVSRNGEKKGASSEASDRDAQRSTEERAADAVEAFCVRYGLSNRESEVLKLLSHGRSAAYIAEELVITQNTAWAHIKRIYAKTGVHSKQDLLSLLEREVAASLSGREL